MASRTNRFRSRRRWRADSISQKAQTRHEPRQITSRIRPNACVVSVMGFGKFVMKGMERLCPAACVKVQVGVFVELQPNCVCLHPDPPHSAQQSEKIAFG